MNDYRYDQRNSQHTGWDSNDGWRAMQRTAAEVGVAERMGFIRKVYALFFTGVLCAVGANLFAIFIAGKALLLPIAQHPIITFLVLIGATFGVSAVRKTPVVNLIAYYAFTALLGVVVAPLMAFVLLKNPTSILQAGFLTTAIFGGLTAYVFISKKDFSFMRGFLVTGLMIVLAGVVVNLFFAAGVVSFVVSVLSLVLFSGFVLYDTSNIIHRYSTDEYIAGAMDLFLDAFNIFIALIRLLNGRD